MRALGVGWGGSKGRWGERSETGRMGRAWGNGMVGMEEEWIREQGSIDLN